MKSAWLRITKFLLLACCIVPAAAQGAQSSQSSQSSITTPDTTLGGALRSLASRAALAFVGQVTSIQRRGSVVEIAFRVDTPVLGNVPGSYTLREWAGLWPPGLSRYHVGERALIFVNGGSSAGLSSPVDGPEGVLPVTTASDGTPLVDVRLLQTRLLRAVGDPLPSAGESAISLADAIATVQPSQSVPPEPPRRPLPPIRKPNQIPESATITLQLPGSTQRTVLHPIRQANGVTAWKLPEAAVASR